MTTYPVQEDAQLADAMTAVIGRLDDHGAVTAAQELRSALTPGNGYRTPAVPHGPVRGLIASAARSVAADGHPASAKLEELAAGLTS